MCHNNKNSNQTYSSYQHTNILLILFVALCVPLMIIFTFYPWFCRTEMHYFDIWIFFLFACWLVYQFFIRSHEDLMIIKTYFDGFIVLLPCLLVVLCLPFPADALHLLSSKIFLDTKWVITHAYWIFDPDYKWNYISLWPQQSIQQSMHGIACVLIFFLIIHTVKTRFQLNVLLYCLFSSLITGTLAACLFFHDWSDTQTFIHVNHHMALIINILIPLSLGFMMSFYKKIRKPVFKTFSFSLKISLTNLIRGEQAILARIALIMSLLFGFFLFARPFGLKMLGLSMILILGGLLLMGKQKVRSQSVIWGFVGLTLIIYALTTNTMSTSNSINHVAIDIFKDYPLSGVGSGALPLIVSRYSSISLDDSAQMSAWFKLLTEYGVLGIIVWISAIIVFFVRMNRMWHKRQSLFNVGWGLGIMMALIATGFFGLGYHYGNPYIVMPLISTLAACGFLVLHAGHRSSRQAFFYRNVTIKRNSWYAMTIAGCILTLIFIGIYQLIQTSNMKHISLQAQTESECIQILKNNKFNADLWHQMAKWYHKQNKDAVNFMKTQLPKADACHEIACYLAPKNNRILFDAARYWVWRSNILSDQTPSHDDNIEIPKSKAQAIINFQNKFKQIVYRQPDKVKSVVDTIWQWYPDDAIVLDAIPKAPKHLKQTALEYVLLQKNN